MRVRSPAPTNRAASIGAQATGTELDATLSTYCGGTRRRAWFVVAVTAAALAAASPAAGATRPSLERAAAGHAGAHALRTARVTSAPAVVYHAPFPSTPVASPLYTYSPGPATAIAPPDPNTVNCAASGTDCTPAEECDIWDEC